MDDDPETLPLVRLVLVLACSTGLLVGSSLFEDAGDLVTDLSSLEEATVGERRVVWRRGTQMPLFVSSV
jgi:hypothetical protein